jgi:hypothetical protein
MTQKLTKTPTGQYLLLYRLPLHKEYSRSRKEMEPFQFFVSCSHISKFQNFVFLGLILDLRGMK